MQFVYAPQKERFKSQKWNNLDTSEEHERKCQILSKNILKTYVFVWFFGWNNHNKKNSIRGNE